jgi:hypothetical protein
MKYLTTAIGCTLMLLLTVPRYGGFMLGFFLLLLIPFFLYSGIRMYRYKNERKTRGVKFSAWMAAIFVTLAVNYHEYGYTRDSANAVVAQIAKYQKTNGTYPSRLEELGYDGKSLKSSLGMYGYSNKDGQPLFFYGVPYIVFDSYRYDFHSGQWIYSN